MKDPQGVTLVDDAVDASDRDELQKLLANPVSAGQGVRAPMTGAVIGKLVGFANGGATPLVIFPGQPTSAAQPARATLDLHAAHIGKNTVMMFEDGDPRRPIILGCLNEPTSALAPTADHVAVDADGQRLVVSAKDQIVLRCGKASITLTKEGHVIVRGAYVTNHSSGVLRLKGGSVQIN
jgi:Domain of unknown function (DUF6484)